MSLSAFNDELSQVQTRKKEFLSQIERLIQLQSFFISAEIMRHVCFREWRQAVKSL